MHHFITIRVKSTLALFLIVLSMSCMDPVIEPEDQYSDYVGGVAAKSLNDPEQGFPNGSFEEDLKYWGGWEGGETGYVTVRTHSPNDSSMAAHGGFHCVAHAPRHVPRRAACLRGRGTSGTSLSAGKGSTSSRDAVLPLRPRGPSVITAE